MGQTPPSPCISCFACSFSVVCRSSRERKSLGPFFFCCSGPNSSCLDLTRPDVYTAHHRRLHENKYAAEDGLLLQQLPAVDGSVSSSNISCSIELVLMIL